MKKAEIGYTLTAKSFEDLLGMSKYFEQFGDGMHMERSGLSFVLMVEDDFEPLADWYSSEIVLNDLQMICKDLQEEGVHFEVSVYGLAF